MKNNFYGLFFSELVFLFATFFFMVFAKNKLAGYILKVQGFSAQAAAMQQGADQAQLTQFLNSFQSVAGNAILFAYVIIPLIIVVIWILTQTGFWYALKQRTIKRWQNFCWKALAGHVIVFAIMYAILFSIPVEFSIFDSTDTSIMKGSIGVLLLFFLMTFLAVLENDSFTKTMVKSWKLFIKIMCFLIFLILFLFICNFLISIFYYPRNIIGFVLLYVLNMAVLLYIRSRLVKARKTFVNLFDIDLIWMHYLGIFLVLAYLFLTLFTTYMEGTIVLFSTVPMALYLMVMMIVGIWLKLMFYNKIQEV